ncbi:MAG: thiamine pyrophosphate-binding protein [Anaerolineae bacterium]|nr:thiamine pyrophosphate-binding protein [Anaerolineae bacterium]
MAGTGAQTVVEMLQAYGVRHVFGVPGDTSMPLYEALYHARATIQHIMARDERAAAFMADVYARLSGRPGVCEAPSGAGASYLLPGLAEANASSIPLIALTSDIPLSGEGRHVLTELDQAALFRAVTRWCAVVKRADKIPETMRKAFRMATTGRGGAVQITLPHDVLLEDVGPAAVYAEPACQAYPAYRTRPEPTAAAEAARLLLKAQRPVIVAGGGVVISRAWDELTALAELLTAPVGTSINGLGSIAATHPLSLGVVGGNGARPYANRVVAEADLVLFVGCKADSVTTNNWTLPPADGSVTVIQVDVDPAEIGNAYPTAVGLVGDARLALIDLLEALRAQAGDVLRPKRERLAEIEGMAAAWWAAQAGKMHSAAQPIKPQRVMQALRQVLPPQTVIVADAGTPTPFTAAFYPTPAGRQVIIPRALGGLGYALPGVVGAKLARPEAPVVGLMGDGSFGMSAGEMETIARLGLPVTLLQFNNGTFGWIKALQHLFYEGHYFSVDFRAETDHAAIAQGFGLRGVRVDDPAALEPVLREALRSEQATFIDVITEPEVTELPPVDKWLRAAGMEV